jgi:predicted PurR-regulated permease PerM
MLGFDRQVARFTWTAALVVLLLVLVYLMRQTLFVFILAILFAYLLAPLVDFLDRVLPTSRTRTPALAIAYMIVVAILVFAVIQIGSRVVEEANTLIKSIPDLLAKWQAPTPGAPSTVNSMKEEVLGKIREQLSQGTSSLLGQLPKAGLKVISVASNVIYVVIVPILSFFFLKDGRRIRDQAVELFGDGPKRDLLEDLLADINVLLAQYMRALLVLCSATFITYSIAFSIMRIPYAILLSALAFGLEFIPMIGPLAAAATILLVAGLSGASILPVLIFLVTYRMFQDYILSPHIMSTGLELHPLMILFGVFAGAEVAGVAGAFLSVPTLALARVFFFRLRKGRAKSRPVEPVPSPAPTL